MNRHPALVARMASTLQILSGGRLVLGIGIAHRQGRRFSQISYFDCGGKALTASALLALALVELLGHLVLTDKNFELFSK